VILLAEIPLASPIQRNMTLLPKPLSLNSPPVAEQNHTPLQLITTVGKHILLIDSIYLHI